MKGQISHLFRARVLRSSTVRLHVEDLNLPLRREPHELLRACVGTWSEANEPPGNGAIEDRGAGVGGKNGIHGDSNMTCYYMIIIYDVI